MEEDPLAAYLDSLARDDCYRVASTLKESAHEVTEVVYFQGANKAELGPFVRKRIALPQVEETHPEADDQPAPASPGSLRPSHGGLGNVYCMLFEAQQAGRRFRHLPRIYDVREDVDSLTVVMEYVAGRTLREEVFRRNPSVDLAKRWFPLLCDGVTELHESFPTPLIHRDLKPSNVIVGGQGLVVVDLGIARPYCPEAEGDTTHFGTRSYAPPEQFGYGQTDVRSDVYALGMILYYLLTERDPSHSVVRNGFSDQELPPSMRAVLTRACAFDPADRFASAAQLKAAFLNAANGSAPDPETQQSPVASWKPPAPETRQPVAASPTAPPSATPTPPAAAPNGSNPPFAFNPAKSSRPQPSWRGPLLTKRTVITLAVWALFLAAVFAMPFDPSGQRADWPLPLRIAFYYGYGIPFVTGVALLCVGDSFASLLLRCPDEQTHFWKLVLGWGLVVLGIVAIAICDAVAGSFGLTA